MARNVLIGPDNGKGSFQLASAAKTAAASAFTSPKARLAARRSAAYMSAFAQLDAGGHLLDDKTKAAIRAAIRAEFPEVSAVDLPLGIVARCHLGHPYEVHTLDCALDIVEHYKIGQALPGGMERARTLARHPSYVFVEVYLRQVRAVSADGTVTTLDL